MSSATSEASANPVCGYGPFVPKPGKVDQEARRWIIALLRREMQARNLTQSDVARMMRVSEGTISNLLQNPVKGCGLDTVLKIHREIGISSNDLLGRPDWQRLTPHRASPSARPGRLEADRAIGKAK